MIAFSQKARFRALILFVLLVNSPVEAGSDRVRGPAELRKLYAHMQSFSGKAIGDHCFYRAHYWARQLENDFGVVSQKAFLLFTPRFQHRHKLNWWYHVVPIVQYEDERGRILDVVMDKAHERGPVELIDWVQRFSGGEGCREGHSLADYNDELLRGGCILVRKSMYHFTPDDLALNKTSWNCREWRRLERYFEDHRLDFESSTQPQECR